MASYPAWQEIFKKARQTPTWRKIVDNARRVSVLDFRTEKVYGTQWVIRDLYLDLEQDLQQKLQQARTKPSAVTLFADVVHVPRGCSVSLGQMGLVIVARRIEVADRAQERAAISLDYRTNPIPILSLYTAEIAGALMASAITQKNAAAPQRLSLTTPQQLGLWIRYTQGKAEVRDRAHFPEEWFQGYSPLWSSAVAAFQMATTLLESEPAIARDMLGFIMRCTGDAPEKAATAAEWRDLARQSASLHAVLAQEGAKAFEHTEAAYALQYASLLYKRMPAAERRRKDEASRRADAARSSASPYELVQANIPRPDPDNTKYVRHGAQTIGTADLNGWRRLVRRVTISGVELIFDSADRSGFLHTYNNQKDIQELYICADAVVIKTGLRFPQTNVFIFSRELYFAGKDAYIDTSPVKIDAADRDPLDIDGQDGAKAGDIALYIQRFGTTEWQAKHFRAVGGSGQDPDEGGIDPSNTVRFLKPLTKEEWEEFFQDSNRRVWHREDDRLELAPAPDWEQYKQYDIVYAEINNTYYRRSGDLAGPEVVAWKGMKEAPGTGGAGRLPGRPGTGGAGGNVVSTVEDIIPYCDLSGGLSGQPLPYTEGGAGGTPDQAYWFFLEGRAVEGQHKFERRLELKEAQRGPNSGPGPLPYATQGPDGSLRLLAGADYLWLTAVNLNVVMQCAKDALANGHADVARALLVPYVTAWRDHREALVSTPESLLSDDVTLEQLGHEATDLAERAIQPYLDYFGNPPGWVPMLSLESAVDIYEKVLKSSMQELYTAYYLEKAAQMKAERQAALESLIKLLTDNTEATRQDLVETRRRIRPLMDQLQQLLVEMRTHADDLKRREEALKRQADDIVADKQQKEAVVAALKIAGAVAKAIPLPEPYQFAAGGIGTLFDVTGNLIDEEASDEAFSALEEQLKSFTRDNKDDAVEAANKNLENDLRADQRNVRNLQEQARKARQAKEALEAFYGEKASKYEELIAKRKAVLEAQQNALVYGRSSTKNREALVKRAGDLTLDFQKFADEQKKNLEAGTQDYLQKKRELDDLETTIKQEQERSAEAMSDLEQQKTKNGDTIKARIKQVQNMAEGVASIAKTVNKLLVSKSQLRSKWDETLAKLKVVDAEFQGITQQLAYLNQRKEEVATALFQLQTDLADQQHTITKNLVMVNELSSQLAHSREALDPHAVAYIQSVSQDAHRDLTQFLYYVVKAYEYYMVESWGQSALGAQKLFDDLRKVLEPSEFAYDFDDDRHQDRQQKLQQLLKNPAPGKDSRLSPEEFELLKMVYEKPLRDMGKRLAQQLLNGAGSVLKEAPKPVTLRAEQLQALNAAFQDPTLPNAIPFNLMQLRQIDQGKEKQRISNIRVVRVQGEKRGQEFPDSVHFKFIHLGKSLVRANGKLYAFEPERGGPDSQGRAARVSFETIGGSRRDLPNARWSTSGKVGILEGEALWQPTPPLQKNLLTKLLRDANDPNASQLDTLSEFRPGVFSEFLLTVEMHPPEAKMELEEVELLITYEAGNAPYNERIVCVSNNAGLAIPITTSVPDMSGRTGSPGSYIGIFNGRGAAGQAAVRISVPAQYGEFVHQDWLIDGQVVQNGQHTYEVAKSAYIVANYVRQASS